MSNELIKLLDWDSNFFGIKIARILKPDINTMDVEHILSWCTDNAIDCTCFLANPGDLDSINNAQSAGFKIVDVRTTLSLNIQERNIPESAACVRLATKADIPTLKQIAGKHHEKSRFYADKNFDRRLCSMLFETWIEKSVNGYADLVFVADHGGKPVGYLSCHLRNKNLGEIGLFAVNSAYGQKGYGAALINSALSWFIQKETKSINVATQIKNIPALALYQKSGFSVTSASIWMHRWQKECNV